ncbi:MAG: DUF4231 domain-containing protein [Candidatus Omnitrophota bacterium]
MENEKFEQYLKERYEDQIRWYSNRSSQNKRYYQWFQWGAIVISTSVPVLVISMPDKYKWFTAILSIILAIATSALKTFKFQENWINYRTISETLKKEKYFYDAEISEYATAEDKEQLLVERVETLISRENTLWVAIHTRKEEEEETEKN